MKRNSQQSTQIAHSESARPKRHSARQHEDLQRNNVEHTSDGLNGAHEIVADGAVVCVQIVREIADLWAGNFSTIAVGEIFSSAGEATKRRKLQG
jgi:hypothetical protein